MKRHLINQRYPRRFEKRKNLQSAHTQSQGVGELAAGPHISSRGLDMCLLAMCSCALSLMCHQTSGLLNMPSVTASSAMNSTSNAPAQVDFMVKAGLVTTRQDSAESEDEA